MAKVIIVGPGRVGTALAVALQHTGHDIVGAYCRNLLSPSTVQFRNLVQAPTVQLPEADNSAVQDKLAYLPAADVYFVTVPDAAVTATAQTLVDYGILPDSPCSSSLGTHQCHCAGPDHQPPIVAHTAGSLSANALAPAQASGSRCICVHPLQTVASAALAPECFAGITFTLDGEDSAVATVSSWVQSFGGVPRVIAGSDRTQYHAAAVLASNAVVALAATAAEVSGLPDGLRALLPLMRGAVENLTQLGLPSALTGPVDRGDVTTVAKHLQALQDNPTAFEVYRTLGLATVTVAEEKGTLTAAQLDSFRELFESGY